MPRCRLDVLRTLGRVASDKIAQLGKQGELVRITRMIENAPLNMMYTDLDLRIQYMNPASLRMIKRLEPYLPIKADQMIGQSIDIFHKKPEHQRRLLADPQEPAARGRDPASAPSRSNLLVTAILDQHGTYLGPMLTWEIVTEQLEAKAARGRDRGRHQRGQPAAPGAGQASDGREVIAAALGTIREAFGWSYATYFEVDPKEPACSHSRSTRARPPRSSAARRARASSARGRG